MLTKCLKIMNWLNKLIHPYDDIFSQLCSGRTFNDLEKCWQFKKQVAKQYLEKYKYRKRWKGYKPKY